LAVVRVGDEFVEDVPEIVIEGMLRIVAPKGGEIQQENVIVLVLLLRKLGVPITWVSTDNWQSLTTRQMLASRGFSVGEISTVKTPVPYLDLRSALYDRRLIGYRYGPAIEELRALERSEKDGRLWRVDHPPYMLNMQGERVLGHNDVADTLAGVTHVLTRQRASWRPTQPVLTELPVVAQDIADEVEY
jgi:hypothetical protein